MVVVREKLLSGGVYEGGAEVLSSVADGTISGEEELGNSDEVSGVSVGASDEDGTELLEGDAVTVTGSAVETSVVGSRVIVGLSTDVIVDRGGADAVETMVVGSS